MLSKAGFELTKCVYDYCWMSGYLSSRLNVYLRGQMKPAPPKKKVSPKENFDEELGNVLRDRLDHMNEVFLDDKTLKSITNEFRQFLACSLTANRTSDEVIDGLRDDLEMREEVVDFLL